MPPVMAAQLSAESDSNNVSFCGSRNCHRLRVFDAVCDLSDFWGSGDGGDLGESFGWIFLLPVVGQEFIKVTGGIFGKSLNDVGQIRPGLDAVASTGRKNREDNSVVRAGTIAAEEQPCLPAHGDVFHFVLRMIVGDFQVAIFDVLGQFIPVVKAVKEGFSERAFGLGEGVLFLKPGMECFKKWHCFLFAH